MIKDRFPGISENHRRHISTVLHSLDRALCEMETWAQGREAHSVLHQEKNNLSPGQADRLLSEVFKTRDLLRELKEKCGLDSTFQYATSFIWGRCIGLWESIEEHRGKHLKGYGALSQEFVRSFDPKVDQILDCFERIKDIMKTKE